jgi:hypothetical protein
VSKLYAINDIKAYQAATGDKRAWVAAVGGMKKRPFCAQSFLPTLSALQRQLDRVFCF